MKKRWSVLFAFAVSGSVCIQALGQGGEAPQLPIAYDKTVLTVSGAGGKYREIYQNGEQPQISAYISGQELPDGIYRYQLRSVPAGSSSTARQQDVIRGGGVINAPSGAPATVVSGKFEVQNGQVIYR